jgi:hypothetical protein
MADEVADDDEDEYDDHDEAEDELYDDYALRGLRFFNNNLDGEEHNEEDVEEETIDTESEENESEAGAEDEELAPVSHVVQKLMDQGVTMEDLLKAILCSCHDYQRDHEDFERVENEIFGRVSTILNNYTPPV